MSCLSSAAAAVCGAAEALLSIETAPRGNPHSGGGGGGSYGATHARAKAALLRHLGCESAEDCAQWEVVWTSGATEALRLASEALPWAPGSVIVHTRENHTSALGMREYALAAGAEAVCVELGDASGGPPGKGFNLAEVGAFQRRIGGAQAAQGSGADGSTAPLAMFVLPAECNFSGRRFSPREACTGKAFAAARLGGRGGSERGSALCVVDAARAAGGGTGAFDLRAWAGEADMVALSLYKICGYPTNLGALLVNRGGSGACSSLLKTGYFGGGTIDAAAVDADQVVRRGDGDGGGSCAPRLQHGTPPFAELCAVAPAIASLEGCRATSDAHARSVAAYAAARLAAMRHANGAPVCRLHGRAAAVSEAGLGAATLGTSCDIDYLVKSNTEV